MEKEEKEPATTTETSLDPVNAMPPDAEATVEEGREQGVPPQDGAAADSDGVNNPPPPGKEDTAGSDGVNNPPPPGKEDTAGSDGAGDPPPPGGNGNDHSIAISYLDLGIQLGLENKDAEKIAHKEFLKQLLTDLETDFSKLTTTMEQKLTKYRDDIKILVRKDLNELLDDIDSEGARVFERMLKIMSIQYVDKYDDVRELIKETREETNKIIGQAQSALRDFKHELSTSMHYTKLEALHEAHLTGLKNLMEQQLKYRKYEKDLEDGFLYGRSVRDFVTARPKPDPKAGEKP